MRRGTNGASVLRNDAGELVAVNLGADYTAEHEWGIKDLKRVFGLREDAAPGIPRQIVHIFPQGIGFSQPRDPKAGLVLTEWKHDHRKDKTDPIKGTSYVVSYTPFGAIREEELRFHQKYGEDAEDPEIVGAWSDGDFAVHFRPEAKADAEDLFHAFVNLDVAFLFGATWGNPFSRGGFVLAIASRLPEDITTSIRAQTEEADALAAAARATGIRARIGAANQLARAASPGGYRPLSHGYYALTPRWADRAKTEVQFWLNPMDQPNNNFGYFTADELDEWLIGAGPIPKANNRTSVKK